MSELIDDWIWPEPVEEEELTRAHLGCLLMKRRQSRTWRLFFF